MMEPVSSCLLKMLNRMMNKINMEKEWLNISRIIVEKNTCQEFDNILKSKNKIKQILYFNIILI
jgi:hypothetical protein